MRRQPTRPDRRGGFTLVELLVVITIIAILFALTAAAVVKAREKSDEVRNRNDISQLQTGIQAFKTDFQPVSYIPDRLILPPGDDPTGESLTYISTLWPRINPAYLAKNNANTRAIWGVPNQSNAIIILQGHQTLIFFLGGARDASGIPIGFSTSPTDPLDKIAIAAGGSPTPTRKGPYFDGFPPPNLSNSSLSRLRPFPYATAPQTTPWTNYTVVTANPGTADSYWSFVDIFGTQPFIYFSSKKAGNDYINNWLQGSAAQNLQYDLQGGCAPFLMSGTRFANPNGFQILSAGRDTLFGTGGLNWAGVSGGSVSMGGYDDISNFHPTLLGVAAQ
jgi:prepilin-type N-terminal cleavage/methylation domain-containing protein